MALLELRIDDMAVVRRGVLELEGGFCVLTGETGSGKSVCIRALQFVLGGRPEAELVPPGGAAVRVVAVFSAAPTILLQRLAALGVPDDDYLTLQRELSPAGRAQCRINGALVSQSVLRDAGDALVEVTGQGESHRLLRPEWQRSLLDASGTDVLAGAREECAAAVSAWRGAVAVAEAGRARWEASAGATREAEAVLAELGRLDLRSGEDGELAAERDRLRHAVAIRAAAEAIAVAATGGGDTGETSGGALDGAADALAAAVQGAAALASLDPGLGALAAAVDAVVVALRELGLDGRRLAGEVVVDPGRLAAVEERLDELERVRRRYGGSIDAALVALEEARTLVEAQGGSGEVQQLETQARAAEDHAAEAAERLSGLRRSAAERLARAVDSRLHRLGLPHARFRVLVDQRETATGLRIGDRRLACSAEGVDEVEFRLAANRDGVPLPLGQGSSGGELSRLALALRATVADAEDRPTLVLDEIDTGVGGETAARVGETLADIGHARQVLAVTHRAEIAARAGHHLLVRKRESPGGARSTIEVVTGEHRVAEVARLLSGRGTPAALARAAELLSEGLGSAPTGSRTMSRDERG
ncbi:MAG: DNA repair protein RecN [Candidatus Dormibacteria bacterium]